MRHELIIIQPTLEHWKNSQPASLRGSLATPTQKARENVPQACWEPACCCLLLQYLVQSCALAGEEDSGGHVLNLEKYATALNELENPAAALTLVRLE